ncbi:MAG: hypothetical protein ACI9WU_001559 [Myxococcota bacterium]|jgi:hypothetical protein
MGVSPLLSERRGFDCLDGTSGEWLSLLGGVAYMPVTLDKALAELALLDVGDALWAAHASQWHRISSSWSVGGPDWLRTVLYVDGTADPYWTRAFARSGKVSKTGRVTVLELAVGYRMSVRVDSGDSSGRAVGRVPPGAEAGMAPD